MINKHTGPTVAQIAAAFGITREAALKMIERQNARLAAMPPEILPPDRHPDDDNAKTLKLTGNLIVIDMDNEREED